MEQKHTPEPWRVSGNGTMRFIDASVGNGMAQEVATCMRVEHGDMEANARRIVACVNACEGIPTDYLESKDDDATKIAKRGYAEILTLRQQRDILLEALECLFDSYKRLTDSGDAGNWWVEDTDEGKKALTAIAAVKGDK